MPQRKDDLTKPVPIPVDFSTVSPHESRVARFRSEDAKTGRQTDETPPTIRRRRSKVKFPSPKKKG